MKLGAAKKEVERLEVEVKSAKGGAKAAAADKLAAVKAKLDKLMAQDKKVRDGAITAKKGVGFGRHAKY